MEIKYVTLYTRNMNNEVKFCTDKLGFKFLKRTKVLDEKECVILINASNTLGLMLIENDRIDDLSVTVTLNTNDFLKDHFELKNHGVSFLGEPEYTPAGIAAAFKDPSGNHWMLIEERDYSNI
ncbi:VOC family protein [Mucilaginibacter litoreus]|uniref:VOC family protein n=1 Tax=Mucilaginibacter litoreus TaxID=1048221 RepID=A0ABW3AMV1_9SPHI